jgi:parallel beta-helix repeat protein
MREKIKSIFISLFLIVSVVTIIDITVNIIPGVKGDVHYVGGGGAQNYSRIQWAIENASDGDSVFVYSGTYFENVIIDKTLTLIGEDRNTTIIDGGNAGIGIQINSLAYVNVSGFTVQNTATSAIYITSSVNCRIAHNNILNNNGDGVFLFWYSDYNTIENNFIKNNPGDGVELNQYCDSNTIANNTIEEHTGYGVLLSITNNFNNIEDNKIYDSNIGLYLWNSNSNNNITGNTVINSSFYGIFLVSANSQNRIVHNNFVDNANHAYDDDMNFWTDAYPFGGNFWGDYPGGDNQTGTGQNMPGNDGIGDVPYNIAGGLNIDSYPLWPNWDAVDLFRPYPGPREVCEYALGSVTVALIFVESNGSIDFETEDWSPSRQSQVLSEIQDALTWWEGQEANSNLSLSLENMGIKNTSYEPITRPHDDEDLWIGEIMDNMGFTTGTYLDKAQSYNHWVRGQYNTDWAYTIFMVDSFNDTDGSFLDFPWCAWAYPSNATMIMTYDNDGWLIGRMNNVTAHETGHMFYATDEYHTPGERLGYLNALEVDDSGCLMDTNNLVLSSGTRKQVGWRDTDGDGIMDILDTIPNTYLIPYMPDPTMDNILTYTGHAVVLPYPNNNPMGSGRDVTINTISDVEYRVDGGTWKNALPIDGAFNEPVETFNFTLPLLPFGTYFIEARAINSVRNNDTTYANDTVTISPDMLPPMIIETTTDTPVSGDIYTVTADVLDSFGVGSVWLDYTITSSEGYSETFNVSMGLLIDPTYWVDVSIWSNATWFNYTIWASDINNNWNGTSEKSLFFRVHNLDTVQGFLTIQAAIDYSDTLDGHTIFVESGIYYENVVVDKSLILIGEDKENTIIDGSGNGDVVNVNVDWVNVSGFTIKNSGALDFPDYDAGIDIRSDNNTISDNNVSSNRNGIYLGSATYTNIKDNIVYNNTYGIIGRTTSNNIISGCNVSFNYQGIYIFEFSSGNNITGNTVLNNSFQGIILYLSSNSNISDNTVSLNEQGIWLGLSVNITIINNTVVYNKDRGIHLYDDSNNITIIDNSITGNSDGIYLSTSPDNIITNNKVISNNKYGIDLWSSSNNNITENTLLNHDYGIYLSQSSKNLIHHNNIINNIYQALDDQSDNYWDNGYPSGGNFWSDYSGLDLYSGPNQDILGNDGIGDTNYTIDSDSRDNYPLTDPMGNFIFLYEGWNLVSIPFIQQATNLDSVLSSIKGSYDAVQWYNISDTSDPWKHDNILKPPNMNDLDNLKHTMGFWIHVIDPDGVLFEYPGIRPIQNQTIELHKGWNLVGFPSLRKYNTTDGLNNITFGPDVELIQWFNPTTKTWHDLEEEGHFVIGRGYWVLSKVDKTWEVPL